MLINLTINEEGVKDYYKKWIEVDEETIRYIKCTDEANWIHKFEGHLGGRDGWSCLVIDRGPDFELDDEYEHIVVDGVEYIICEGD